MDATNKVNMDYHGGKDDEVGGKNVSSGSLTVSHFMHSPHDVPLYPHTCSFLPCPMSHYALLRISGYSLQGDQMVSSFAIPRKSQARSLEFTRPLSRANIKSRRVEAEDLGQRIRVKN